MRNGLIIILLIPVFFFIVSFLTLKDYGISWDETIHFRRGQAYLHYFLTGKTNYSNLPTYNLQGTNGDPSKIPTPRRSFYQNDFHNGQWFLENDTGHPPLSDELAAFSNYIFYQKLGILNDISAYHLFNIIISSLLVLTISWFMFKNFGILISLISSLSLVTYPLFFSEAHFNIKDPIETTFFSLTAISLIELIERFSWKWVLVSILSLGLALGTKVNIIFLIFILGPYLIIKYKPDIKRLKQLFLNRKYLIATLFIITVPFAIAVISWPFVFQNFPGSLLKIFNYYQNIGFGTRYQPDNFFILGFNSFPMLWIIFTTPPLVLFLTMVGLISAIKNYNKFKYLPLLFILWFFVPIIRVTLPGTVIYGGDRQIMEFLPAMIMLTGVGAYQILEWTKKFTVLSKRFVIILLISLFLFPALTIYKLHPNENVYFNFLIGGLRGAQQHNFPSWGNSFGNAYFAGIEWLNKNAEPNAKVALIQGTASNAPSIFFRSDLDYKNSNFSGDKKEGEYIMELTFNDTTKTPPEKWNYVEQSLSPVYELKVEGVPILKIWKNDEKNFF